MSTGSFSGNSIWKLFKFFFYKCQTGHFLKILYGSITRRSIGFFPGIFCKTFSAFFRIILWEFLCKFILIVLVHQKVFPGVLARIASGVSKIYVLLILTGVPSLLLRRILARDSWIFGEKGNFPGVAPENFQKLIREYFQKFLRDYFQKFSR